MSRLPVTTVSQLTPTGRGAIATVAVAGPMALDAVTRCFRARRGLDLRRARIGQIVLGTWHPPQANLRPSVADAPAAGEELIVCRIAEDRLEVHCHGGTAAAAAIIASLVQQGCEVVEWQHAIQRPDETAWQQSARVALASAATESVALHLLDQYEGALVRDVHQVIQLLESQSVAAATQRLEQILGLTEFGRHLLEPWQVVLAGPPNVGKSSLINALVGYQRAVVFDQPGTTRDVVAVRTAVAGWPIELCDTAGLRESADPLEVRGIGLARRQIHRSDLLVLVLDIHLPYDVVGRHLDDLPFDLLVINKCDQGSPQPLLDLIDGRVRQDLALPTSALTGAGIESLLQAIAAQLVPNVPAAGTGIPYTAEQAECLRQAVQRLSSGANEDARLLLAQLLR
jgi:tRNA modification GTPase